MKASNLPGKRVIPLNTDALAAVLELRQRSKLLFECEPEPEPEWYVLPHAEGLRNPCPTMPMSGWRTAWRNLTRTIQCPACGRPQKPAKVCSDKKCKTDIGKVVSPTAGLRFHDLRHHAITELAEGQASEQTIRSIAGHVSQKMLEHYSHIRIDAKREALDALSQKRRRHPMTQITSQTGVKPRRQMLKLLRSLVDERGFELPASSLRTVGKIS